MLVKFCQLHDLVASNSYFEKRKEILWMWKSRDGKTTNQIGIILVQQDRFLSFANSEAISTPDNPDHKMISAPLNIRLKAVWLQLPPAGVHFPDFGGWVHNKIRGPRKS